MVQKLLYRLGPFTGNQIICNIHIVWLQSENLIIQPGLEKDKRFHKGPCYPLFENELYFP